jgi:hypothetical protein
VTLDEIEHLPSGENISAELEHLAPLSGDSLKTRARLIERLALCSQNICLHNVKPRRARIVDPAHGGFHVQRHCEGSRA